MTDNDKLREKLREHFNEIKIITCSSGSFRIELKSGFLNYAELVNALAYITPRMRARESVE